MHKINNIGNNVCDDISCIACKLNEVIDKVNKQTDVIQEIIKHMKSSKP